MMGLQAIADRLWADVSGLFGTGVKVPTTCLVNSAGQEASTAKPLPVMPMENPDRPAAITGNIAASGVSVTVNTAGYNLVTASIDGTFAGLALAFEALFQTTWLAVLAMPVSGGNPVTSQSNLAAAIAWDIYCPGATQVRVRSTAWTSGTATVTLTPSYAASDPAPSLGGGALGAGSNVIGKVRPVQNQVTDVASAAITTTTTTSTLTPTDANGGYEVVIPVTAVSGTSPTMDVVIQESDDGGTNWFDVYHFERITATGTYRSRILPYSGNRRRYVQTIGGTTPSFTRSIVANEFPGVFPPVARKFITRSVDPATLNSATGWFNIEGCDTLELMAYVSTYAATFTLSVDISDDASQWILFATVAVTATGVVRVGVSGCGFKFARIRTSVAGAGNTMGYARLAAWKG